MQARRHVRGTTTETKELERTGAGNGRKCHACGEESHDGAEATASWGPGVDPDKGGGPKTPVKCYNCGELGHISTKCPERANYYCMGSKGHSAARERLVDGTPFTDILLNSGSTKTMVREDLVAKKKLLSGEAVTVLCTHRTRCCIPWQMSP